MKSRKSDRICRENEESTRGSKDCIVTTLS